MSVLVRYNGGRATKVSLGNRRDVDDLTTAAYDTLKLQNKGALFDELALHLHGWDETTKSPTGEKLRLKDAARAGQAAAATRAGQAAAATAPSAGT